MSTLFLVGTPIGNLEDITARALRVLREVSLLLAEDTRQTKKLLAHFDIHTKLESFHEYSDPAKIAAVLRQLESGASVALVTDAGTPGISGPGSHLVSEVVRVLGERVTIVPIPGVSAVTA